MSEVNFKTDKIIDNFDTKIKVAMKQAIMLVEADAKKNCPVDTGKLRSSITNVVEKIKDDVIRGRVGTPVEYAPYVELGTSKQQAQPYLRPALENNFDKIIKLLKAAV